MRTAELTKLSSPLAFPCHLFTWVFGVRKRIACMNVSRRFRPDCRKILGRVWPARPASGPAGERRARNGESTGPVLGAGPFLARGGAGVTVSRRMKCVLPDRLFAVIV